MFVEFLCMVKLFFNDAFRLEGPPLGPHHQGGRHRHRQVVAEGTGLFWANPVGKWAEDISDIQWIGLRENLQENPIFNGKIYGFL